MSAYYDSYLKEHMDNVANAYFWLDKNIPSLFIDHEEAHGAARTNCLYNHDASKQSIEEYSAYDDYFYGKKTPEVKLAFDYAWLHHIHENPHHWQHWILYEDEGKVIPLEIPFKYVIEMICDWWSFSWKEGNLYEIFDWYDKHRDKMLLHQNTKKLVEHILEEIRYKLDAK